jgi:tetratricopeptide (TPR) repeat protein
LNIRSPISLAICLVVLSIISACSSPNKNEREHYYQAQRAIDSIDQKIKSDPTNIDNYILKSAVHESLRKFELQLVDVQDAMRVCESHELPKLKSFSSKAQFNLGNLEKAKEDLNYFLNNYSRDTDDQRLSNAYLNMGKIELRLRNREQARLFFERAIKENEGVDITIDAEAYLGLSDLSTTAEESLDLINKALALNPDFADGYANRAILYMNYLNKPHNAYSDLKKARRLVPNDPAFELNTGLYFAMYAERIDSSIFYAKKAKGNAVDSKQKAHISSFLGSMYAQIGDISMAKTEFDLSLSLDKTNDNIFFTYAQFLADQENYNEAIEQIDAAIKINPDEPEYHMHKGLLYLYKSFYAQAESSFKESIRLDKDNGGAYYNLGFMYGEKGDGEKAVEYYSKAISLDFDLPRTLVNRAIQYKELGKTVEACDDLHEAFKLGRYDVQSYMDDYCN